MFRIFIFSFLLTSCLFAEVFQKVFISIDNSEYFNINGEIHIDKKENQYVKLKLQLDKEFIKNDEYYIKLKVDINNLISSTEPYVLKDNIPLIKIDKNIKKDIEFEFIFDNIMPIFDITIYNDFEYKYLINDEKLLFGIAYGIIICAFLYSLVFYFNNKDKAFLYYSLFQLSSFLLLYLSFMPIQLINLISYYDRVVLFFATFVINFVFILAILFNMEFLNTKKYAPFMHKIFIYILYLNIIDLILMFFIKESILYEYVPSSVFLFLFLISAFTTLKKGYKTAIFYIIGWMTLFIVVLVVELEILNINELYLLHLGIPLESLLFSFALGYKVKEISIEKQKNEQLLINQSKLAAMGEMINNIAHQWRQPLTHLSFILMNLKTAYEKKKLTPDYFNRKAQEANIQIEFMSNTINDFRNFFKSSKVKNTISLKSCVDESISLLLESFKENKIQVFINCKEDLKIKTYKGELLQVIFNLLNNAKDELILKKIINPQININIYKKNFIFLEIEDNAGGIEQKSIEKIFEPYFTTKEEGFGIGLYMSKVIIEKNLKGKLEVENTKYGALFRIVFKNSKSLDS